MKHLLLILISSICFLINAETIQHKHFTLNYNEEYEIPVWVSYSISIRGLVKHSDRLSYFRSDKKIDSKSAVNSDYTNTNYDRGHMAPAAAFAFSEQAMTDSFLMSNITPQVPEFNRGMWKKLEEYIREKVILYDQLYIITGCVVIGKTETIGKNKVGVPKVFYKVVFDKNKNFLFAVVMPNKKIENQDVTNFFTSLEFVKAFSGINTFKDKLRE